MASAGSSSAGVKRRSDWEDRVYRQADEAPGGGGHGLSDDDDGELTPDECSAEFFDYLVELKLKGVVTAKMVCILAFWAKGASMTGKGCDLACSPVNQGGSFSRHFDKVMGFGKVMGEGLYELAVPGTNRSVLGRSVIQPCTLPPHDLLSEELAVVSNLAAKVRQTVNEAPWKQAYAEHPVVVASPGVPVCATHLVPGRSAIPSTRHCPGLVGGEPADEPAPLLHGLPE